MCKEGTALADFGKELISQPKMSGGEKYAEGSQNQKVDFFNTVLLQKPALNSRILGPSFAR